MNAATAVITLIIAACLAYAVYNIIIPRRNGGCGSCPSCSGCGVCKIKEEKKN